MTKDTLLVLLCVLSTFAIADAWLEYDYCVKHVDYARSVLPNNGTTATGQEIDHALKALARDDDPVYPDCWDFCDWQTVYDVQDFFKTGLPTCQFCDDWFTADKVTAWIYCTLHRKGFP